MTVQNTIVKNVYKGNGSTTIFPFTFSLIKVEHIKCFISDSNGTKETTNFTVGDNGVTYPKFGTALQSGQKITILRELPLYQVLNLVNQGPLFAEDIEKTFDEIVMMLQQIDESNRRALKLSVSEEISDIIMELPREPNKGWRWDAEGKRIVSMENPESVLAECYLVKEQTEDVRDTTATYRDKAEDYMLSAEKWAHSSVSPDGEANNKSSKSWSEVAKAWAESTGSPDGLVESRSSKSWTDVSKEWAQGASSPDGLPNSKSSKGWSEYAAGQAAAAEDAAKRAQALASAAETYSSTKTYNAGDLVMLPNGETYRCLTTSTGENPIGSKKWAIVSTVISTTFEVDSSGDLMPLLNPEASLNWSLDENGDIQPANML